MSMLFIIFPLPIFNKTSGKLSENNGKNKSKLLARIEDLIGIGLKLKHFHHHLRNKITVSLP